MPLGPACSATSAAIARLSAGAAAAGPWSIPASTSAARRPARAPFGDPLPMRPESASLRDRPSPDPDDAALRLAAAPWPAAALAALARLREGGHQAVLVGGSVRDVLLGRPPHHVLDVATDLTPDRVSAR